jgi:hypothetical protein
MAVANARRLAAPPGGNARRHRLRVEQRVIHHLLQLLSGLTRRNGARRPPDFAAELVEGTGVVIHHPLCAVAHGRQPPPAVYARGPVCPRSPVPAHTTRSTSPGDPRVRQVHDQAQVGCTDRPVGARCAEPAGALSVVLPSRRRLAPRPVEVRHVRSGKD